MTNGYYSNLVASFMFCSICLYVVMPKVLSHFSGNETANMIFMIIWSVMTTAGVALIIYGIFY